MNRLMLAFIRGYRRWISPLLGPRCRFYPTCSAYCLEAFQCFGFFKAAKLCIIRLLKCHPFHPGGHDPIRR